MYTKRKLIYISGRIEGFPNAVLESKIKSASLYVQLLGHTPLNPMVGCEGLKTEKECLWHRIQMLKSSGGAYFFNNWEDSLETQIEHEIAELLKEINPHFEIIYQEKTIEK